MACKVSPLERAFQLARSGRIAKVDEIRKQLRQEGYDENVVDGGTARPAGVITNGWRAACPASPDHARSTGPPAA